MTEEVTLEALGKVLSPDSIQLPSVSEIEKEILTDDWTRFQYRGGDSLRTLRKRDAYTDKTFAILTHEFMCALRDRCKELGISSVIELACGVGWLSWWMMKYEIPVKGAVDDFSGPWFKRESGMSFVKEQCAVQCVRFNTCTGMFVLSWPWMDDLAIRVWKAMRPGQYLLYIGENGGCNADEEFCNLLTDDEGDIKVERLNGFVSFWGIHDRPYLMRKEEENE